MWMTTVITAIRNIMTATTMIIVVCVLLSSISVVISVPVQQYNTTSWHFNNCTLTLLREIVLHR